MVKVAILIVITIIQWLILVAIVAMADFEYSFGPLVVCVV